MKTTKVEPYLMSVLSKRFEIITNQMTNTILRTARSGVVNTARDFSCTITDSDARLITTAEGIPVHIGSSGLVVEMMNKSFDDIKKGDCYLNNSPFHGNTHSADYTLSAPVFYKGEYLFSTIARVHQADCGNTLPTTYMPYAKDMFEEGAPVFPCVRIQRDYEDVDEIIRMAKIRVRVPDLWYGDYLAAIGACRVGEKEIVKLCEKYGVDVIKSFVNEWQEYGEKKMKESISNLPKGTWEYTTFHDSVPNVASEGIKIHVKMDINPDTQYITLDFTESDDTVSGGLNLSEATTLATAYTGVMNNVDSSIPRNDGAFSRIKLKIRDNCVVGKVTPPHSASMATTNVADRLINGVQACFAQVGENMGIAEGALGMQASMAVISGFDWRNNNEAYVNQIFLGLAGGPATYGHDGWMSYGYPVVAGVLYQDSVEVDEQRFPIIIDNYEYIENSEGAGQWRGAPGVRCKIRQRNNPGVWIYPGDGHDYAPKGVLGGGSGKSSDAWKYDIETNEKTDLAQFGNETIQTNEVIVSDSCGGGGYGNPLMRNIEKVKQDVQDGFIDIKRAKSVYGVVILFEDEKLVIDYVETEKVRARGVK